MDDLGHDLLIASALKTDNTTALSNLDVLISERIEEKKVTRKNTRLPASPPFFLLLFLYDCKFRFDGPRF